jgi:hypothetical protein
MVVEAREKKGTHPAVSAVYGGVSRGVKDGLPPARPER